jgi:hypothetical protein
MKWNTTIKACLGCGEKSLFLRFSSEIELISMKFLHDFVRLLGNFHVILIP